MVDVVYKDLGLIDFKQAWEFQEDIFTQIIAQKTGKSITEKNIPNQLLFCEHPHVYTLGKSGSDKNLLIDMIQLQAKDATFYRINRGGDITYHGPGQIVCYPIFDLELFGMGIKKYVDSLEEMIIRTLSEFNISCTRLEGATGVWLDTDKPTARKIAAIGVRTSRYVSMHGFALNVNTDLSYFGHINPCGFVDKSVTSLAKETGVAVDITLVKELLKKHFIQVFSIRFL
ncbi:MAG: lipoyl(octanoyl) transferase LipB [Bacteroidota bacterium]